MRYSIGENGYGHILKGGGSEEMKETKERGKGKKDKNRKYM